jgi:DNA mismatch repair protein MutS2
MRPGGLRALEFDRIVAAVRSFALTPTGAARLDALTPATELAEVRESLAATTEAVGYLVDNPVFPLRAPEDLEQLLGLLHVEGRALEPARLLALADYLESIDTSAAAVRRSGGEFPRLRALVGRAPSFTPEIDEVRRKIAPPGEVLDQASALLASLRDRLRKQRTRLRGTLESYLRGKETSKYLQDQVVTERNGRFVLLVKAEHRASLPGLVHGTSSSGATLYLEPLATVEINNDLVALEAEEAEEVQRILLELTDRFRARADDVAVSEEVATSLDVLQAKARLAEITGATPPTLSTDGRLELLAARHPLLMRGVVSRYADDVSGLPESPTPVDIKLVPPATALLVTGPNTGGKTVALKTAGLLPLMAQAGLHIPVEPGSSVPVFRSVFADIGDEQSIASSLSTFGWHITNIASMDRDLQLPALVLLDEIGAGTDPLEGGALGASIVDHFRRRGALVVGTTHYDALKAYAATTPGVEMAAFAFDPATFAPTYRLLYGSPGRSLALEMAERLGLTRKIIDRARESLGTREAELAERLERVDKELSRLAEDRRAVAKQREEAAEVRRRVDQRDAELKEREAAFRRKLTDRIDERVRAASREIDSVVQALKRQTSALATREIGQPRLSTGDQGSLKAHARAAVEAAAARALDPGARSLEPDARPASGARSSEPLQRPASVGDRVIVPPFGLEGIVKSIADGQAEVDVNGKRLRAPAKTLTVLGGKPSAPATVRVNVDLAERSGSLSDLNVIGCTVDEALDKAGRFLDETLVTDQRTVRVIHGHGTGRLQKAIAGFLKSHPLVANFHAASLDQGGGGVTVVELKE